jgi:hypothetical protein
LAAERIGFQPGEALLLCELDELRVVVGIHQPSPLDVKYLDDKRLAIEIP